MSEDEGGIGYESEKVDLARGGYLTVQVDGIMADLVYAGPF